MATRQYIGARYVIKVYENTQDAGSAEWESGTSYEPLTMVTYQNSSYLSKKAVPSTVGNPASNNEYWVITGAYNGQIASLQNQIDEINSTIEDVPELLYKEYITNGVTKYNYNGYCIYVTEVEKGAKPKVFGTAVGFFDMTNLVNELDASILINASLYNLATERPVGNIISDGTIISNAPLGGGEQCVAFKDDGKMECFAGDYSTSELINNGFNNAVCAWGSIIKNGTVDSASIATMTPADDTSQQNIAIDSDNNYYIITTSYNCPLNMTQIAQWILTEIPTVVTAASLDGGGSVATYVNGIQINAISDTAHSSGRNCNGVIYFEAKNKDKSDGSLLSLSRSIQLMKNYFNPVMIVNDYNNETYASGINIKKLFVHQVGSIVMGHCVINVSSEYAGGWVDITDYMLPRIDGGGTMFPIIGAYGKPDSIRTGRISIENKPGNSQKLDFGAKIMINVPVDSPTINMGDFDVVFMYVTKQDKYM